MSNNYTNNKEIGEAWILFTRQGDQFLQMENTYPLKTSVYKNAKSACAAARRLARFNACDKQTSYADAQKYGEVVLQRDGLILHRFVRVGWQCNGRAIPTND